MVRDGRTDSRTVIIPMVPRRGNGGQIDQEMQGTMLDYSTAQDLETYKLKL